MSSGMAMSIQFLLVTWSVGVGCKSFWYSICGEEGSQGRAYSHRLVLLSSPALGTGTCPFSAGPHPSRYLLTGSRPLNKLLIRGRTGCKELSHLCRLLRAGRTLGLHLGPSSPAFPPSFLQPPSVSATSSLYLLAPTTPNSASVGLGLAPHCSSLWPRETQRPRARPLRACWSPSLTL